MIVKPLKGTVSDASAGALREEENEDRLSDSC